MKSFRFKIAAAVLVGIATIFLSNLNSRADIIFRNFGPGDSYDTSIGWTVSGPDSPYTYNIKYADAMSFTVSGTNYNLDAIRLAAALAGGTNALDLALMTNNGGVPGVALETFSLVGVLGPFTNMNNPPLLVNSVLRPLLQNGAEYWLVASAIGDTWAAWYQNSINQRWGLQNENGGPWISYYSPTGAFEITATPVPEPTTLLLLGSGLVGLWGARKKFKK